MQVDGEHSEMIGHQLGVCQTHLIESEGGQAKFSFLGGKTDLIGSESYVVANAAQ